VFTEAIEAEANAFVNYYKALKAEDGKQRIIRNGYLPQREIQTGIGAVPFKAPRVRNKECKDDDEIKFTSHIQPKYLRKTKSMEALIPWLYLRGISTGSMCKALSVWVGRDASGFPPAVVNRLKESSKKEHD
jgi:transposase-like protein